MGGTERLLPLSPHVFVRFIEEEAKRRLLPPRNHPPAFACPTRVVDALPSRRAAAAKTRPLTKAGQTAAAAASKARGSVTRSDCRPPSRRRTAAGSPPRVPSGRRMAKAGDPPRQPEDMQQRGRVSSTILYVAPVGGLGLGCRFCGRPWRCLVEDRGCSLIGRGGHFGYRPPSSSHVTRCTCPPSLPFNKWSHWLCSAPPAARRTASFPRAGPPHSDRSRPLPSRSLRTLRHAGGQEGAAE